MMNTNLSFFDCKIIIFNTTKTILLRSNEFSKHNGRFESYFQTELLFIQPTKVGARTSCSVTQNKNNKYCILLPFVIKNINYINGKYCSQIVKLPSIRADKDDHKIKSNAL